MRYRFLLIAALLAGGFVYLTSVARWPRRFYADAGASAGPAWSETSVAHGKGLSSDELNNIDIYKTAHLATVNISSTVYKRDFFFQIYPTRDQGSGFLISDDGRILTNNHVLGQGRGPIEVTLHDQSKHPATVLARDPANDLGLIKITPRKKLLFLPLGDSDGVQVGQKVLAIGNPFGLEGTLTTGIVSSMGRSIRDENGQELEGMIQTDAAINPGNSGGPLLDSQGGVIGINTAIYGPGGNIGIGFAMPVNRAKALLSDFQPGRSFQRPRLGVSVVPVRGEFAEALDLPREGGLLIQEVSPDSAAARAGLRGARRWAIVGNSEIGIGGDLITAIDGRTIDRNDAIARALSRKRAGDTIELSIYRGGRSQAVRVTLGAAPE